MNEEGKKRMEEISVLNSRMNRLQTENDKNKKEIRNLKETNEILTEREKKEQERKKVKEKNRKTVNEQFSKDKDDIKSKKIGEYKKEINKFLIEIYINDFEKKEGKNKSSITLIKSFEKFTQEFMKQSENYNLSFEENSKKIIEQYDPKHNNISIEHINFILIGPAGVGKSSFINQCLLLDNDKKAREGIGESVRITFIYFK